MTDEQENKREYFTMLPSCVIRDMGLTHHEIAVYTLIVSRAGWEPGGYCSESQNHMAARLHMSRQTLSRALKKLTSLGLIRGYKAMHPRTLNIQNIYIPDRDIWEKNAEYLHRQAASSEWHVLGPARDEPPAQNETGVAQIETGVAQNSMGDDETETGGYDEFVQGVGELDAGDAQNKATKDIPVTISPNDIPVRTSQEPGFGSKNDDEGIQSIEPEPESEPSVVVVSILDIYEKNFHQMADETKAEQLNTLVETLSYQATARAVEFCAARRLDFGYVPTYAKYYANQPVTA